MRWERRSTELGDWTSPEVKLVTPVLHPNITQVCLFVVPGPTDLGATDIGVKWHGRICHSILGGNEL
jgi:hypothetical protein